MGAGHHMIPPVNSLFNLNNRNNFKQKEKENSSLNSNRQVIKKKLSNLSDKLSVQSRKSSQLGKQSSCLSQSSANGNSSRSSSNAFKGDRFIPFRGVQDNYFEEFIINNDFYKDNKVQEAAPQLTNNGNTNTQTNNDTPTINASESTSANATGNNSSSTQQNTHTGDSNNQSMTNIQYTRGSSHKKQQSFQDLITESLFTVKRGSPNTVTSYEAQEEENLRVRITDFNNRQSSSVVSNQRVLSFKEKKSRPSMSLANNISLIAAIAKEKTHSQ